MFPAGSKSPNGFRVELGKLTVVNKFIFAGVYMPPEKVKEVRLFKLTVELDR